MPQANIIGRENFLSKCGQRGIFYTSDQTVSNKSKSLLHYTTVIDVILVCAKKKKGQASTYPEGSLSCFIRLLTRRIHLESTAYVISSCLFTPQAPSPLLGHPPNRPAPPARRRVALQKRCITRNVALKRETPELIPSMALNLSSLLLLDSREA
ncbi:hypothetical protein N7453_010820 [Penicillium expansum]|nr:hypothetical protein N7453_010820 [Penicillium expansum]